MKKASKQIKETKKELGLESAKGLVIMFNDGFYGLTPNATIAVFGDILRNQFPAIEGLVYVTLRKSIEIPNDQHKRIVWLPKYHDSENEALGNFVNWLGQSWFDYLEKIFGAKFLSTVINEDPHNEYIKRADFE